MLPVLYSFRRCPFAIRARMTLRYAEVRYELREVSLKNKPAAMLLASAKATVPTMILPDGRVLDESIDIMNWALQRFDPESWLPGDRAEIADALINQNDTVFKRHLDHYKYSDRFPEHPEVFYRDKACRFLLKLEDCLTSADYLVNDRVSMVDIAVFPFIRQFAFVDKLWFDQAPYPALQAWLQHFLDADLFKSIMTKYSAWHESNDAVIISGNNQTPFQAHEP